MAQVLMSWFGRTHRSWLQVHDSAFEWWLNKWNQNQKLLSQPSKFEHTFRNIEIGWIKQILNNAYIPADWTNAQLFNLDRDLMNEIGKHASLTYPWLKNILRQLTDQGHILYVSSGGDSVFIKSAVRATGLQPYFREVFAADNVGVVKTSSLYWKRIFNMVKSEPKQSIVVDDRIDYLQASMKTGAYAIRVTKRSKRQEPLSRLDVTLSSLRKLPEIIGKIKTGIL